GADDKEAAGLIESVEASEVQIPAVHHVEGTGFRQQQIEHVDIVHFAVGDVNKAGNCTAQVEQRMQLHRRFGGAKRGPRKHRQAQIDGRGIERVNRVVEFHTETV